MARNKGRIKKWIQFNKPAVIWMAIILVYTLIMLAIILGSGLNMKNCTSGSLSSKDGSNVNVETSMKTPS